MTFSQAAVLHFYIFSAEKAMIQTLDCCKYKIWSVKHGSDTENGEISGKDESNEYFSSY